MSKRKSSSLDLVSLGRSSYVSHSGISKLVSHLRDHGVPETFDNNAQYRARKDLCRSAITDYGPLVVDVDVPLANGGMTKLSLQNPLACFSYHCKHSEHFGRLVELALDKTPSTPSSPWRLIVYQDGVDPSDGLAKNHSRKSAVFYYTWAELGAHALSHEEVWMTACVARYAEHKTYAGGVSMVFQKVLESFFGEQHDIMRSGVAIETFGGRRQVVFARASILLADLPAIKECISCKGHAGTLCCCLCMNALLHTSSAELPLHLLADSAASIACTDFAAFKKHTDDTIKRVVQKLNSYHDQVVAGTMRQDEFDTRSQMLGFNWTPANIVLNEKFQLGVASMVMFDWAHIYVHDGLADHELGSCMKQFSRSKTCYQEMGTYVFGFTYPKSAPSLAHLFTPAANANNARKGSFSCTGSEFLTLAPVLHRYFDRVVSARGECMKYVRSMVAVLQVVVLLTAVRSSTVSASELSNAILAHLLAYKAAYGDAAFRPKHHYALHLGPQLQKFGFLLATFVHERKHRLITRYTRDRKNLSSWTKGAIEEITAHQVWQVNQKFLMSCRTAEAKGMLKVPLEEVYPGVSKFFVYNDIRCNGGRCSAGDVVSCIVHGQPQLGQLLVSVAPEVPGSSYVIESFVAIWQKDPASHDPVWCNYFVSGDRVVKVPTEMIDTVFTCKMSPDSTSCVVFLPPEVRDV